jgi:NADPH-dependent 2,4-dienoyl-CoA reductase/sulfur reductase-like enzyme
MERDIVIVGGCAAGMSAAAQARRVDPSAKITVFEKGGYISYAPCGIPYFITGEVKRFEDLYVYTPEQFSQQRNVDVLVHHEVKRINVGERTVEVVDLRDGKEFKKGFTTLLIATGAVPIIPPIPGTSLKGVFKLRDLDDALQLKRFIEEEKPRKVVVVGGGYIGLEIATAFHQIGMDVSLVEMKEHILPNLDEEITSIIERECRDNGVELFLGESLLGLEGDGKVRQVQTSARRLDCELVILALGVRPNVQLAKQAGIPLGVTGAIRVKMDQETDIPGIYSAGDCSETKHIVSGKPYWFPIATVANKQGRIAGENMAGGRLLFPGTVGTQVMKVFGLEVAVAGFSEKEAMALGYETASATVRSSSNASYYPDSQAITTKMVMDVKTRRVLGVQMVGRKGVAKRIDSAAVALHAQMTVDEVAWLDLSYAPPFAPVWDALIHAGQSLRAKTI